MTNRSTHPEPGPDALWCAAQRLIWCADHIGFVTDDHGRTWAGDDAAQEAFTLAERINALELPEPPPGGPPAPPTLGRVQS